MLKIIAGIAPALVLACAPALAQNDDATRDSRYSYLQGAYIPHQNFDTDAGDEDADGFNVNAAWHFVDQAYLFGRGDFSDLDGGSDYSAYTLGLGLRGPLGDTRSDVADAGQIDLYLELGYEDIELEASDTIGGDRVKAKLDGQGYGANLGLRWMATADLEINPFVGYVNYGEPDVELRSGGDRLAVSADEDLDGLRYGLRGVLDLSYSLAATASFERTELGIYDTDLDANTVRVGLRWYFPSRGFTVR